MNKSLRGAKTKLYKNSNKHSRHKARHNNTIITVKAVIARGPRCQGGLGLRGIRRANDCTGGVERSGEDGKER